LEELQARHADLMSMRPEHSPGQWKLDVNIAGNTTFVLPDYVPGSLKAGFEIAASSGHPFARAVLLHFLVSDVHPFDDGNGRVSRIIMTKELVGSGLSRIVIPTVFRDDYVANLRRLTRHGEPEGLASVLATAQRITAACAAAPVDEAIRLWATTYAFVEAGRNARFQMPDTTLKIEWQEEVPAPAEYWEAEKSQPLLGLR
jgi:hypothetical protein